MNDLRKIISTKFEHFYLPNEDLEKITDSLIEFCKANKIGKIKYLDSGESSIAFEYKGNIIKVSCISYDNHPSLKEYVSHSKYILQPIDEKIIDLGYFSVKILQLKKLQMNCCTSSQLLDIYCKLRDDGYLWYDTRPCNVGKDENGNYYLVDYGELFYINDMDALNRLRHLHTHSVKKPELDTYYNNLKRTSSIDIKTK